MWRRIIVPSKWKAGGLFSRSITNGRATPLGTKYFLEQGNVSMIHSLKNSKLNIHPLILNTPMHPTSNKEGLDSLYLGSVLKYRINCFHVYSRSTPSSCSGSSNVWYTTAVEDLVQTGIDREGLVTIANLGKISHRDELMQVLEEAWTVTDQEYIDIVTLEYNQDWKEGRYGDYPGVVNFLEELCEKNILHAYGFTLNIEPFNQHTPALGGHFGNSDIPIRMEVEMREKLPHCDLVFYPLSPTIAVPTNTSLLPPEEDQIEYQDEASVLEASQDDYNESDRLFTRVACDPFSCYRGHGIEPEDDEEEEGHNGTGPDEEEEDTPESLAEKDPQALRAALEAEKRRDREEGRQEESGAPQPNDPVLFLIDKVLPPNITQLLNDLLTRGCPPLSSTPRLEDKVLRVCLSYGHEVCTIQPEVLTLLDEFSLKRSDLLTLDEAGRIFGGFMIPQEIDDILRESTHDADEEQEGEVASSSSRGGGKGDGYDRYGRTFDMDAESDEEMETVRQGMLREEGRGGAGGGRDSHQSQAVTPTPKIRASGSHRKERKRR